MARKSYTDADKERVYAMYAAGVSGREISRQIDIPEATIRLWLQQARTARSAQPDTARNCANKIIDLEEVRAQKRIEFINSAWDLIGKSIRLADKRVTRALEHEGELDELIGEIDATDMNDKTKQALISKVRELQIQNVREISTLIGIMYDKAALAAGDPTQKVESDGGVVFTFDNLPEGTKADDITG